MQEQQKIVVETGESSNNIDPGEMLQAGLRDGRQPRCSLSLGNGRDPLPKENSRSSRHRLLCSYLNASTPTFSEHNPKFPVRKNLPHCLLYPLSFLFFPHHDWKRWFTSLATMVDNTIKMADRSFKHGHQWCIHSNRVEFFFVTEIISSEIGLFCLTFRLAASSETWEKREKDRHYRVLRRLDINYRYKSDKKVTGDM